jgi:DNA processing protein
MSVRNWLQLALTDGIGPVLGRRLIAAAGSPAAACGATADLLRTVDGVASKATKIAASLRSAAGKVDAELGRAAAAGATVICQEDQAYPPLLREIPDPPLVLYVRGTLEPRDLNGLAIVGSRKCSLYGREQAERFGSLLAGAGFTVVSGGARGTDTAAHRGAILHPAGRTIAVLGSGVDVAYPPENASLFEQLARRGAVVSEYPMGTPPAAENFPKRNRIVSGMSRGVLVVEADERSGALITARQAADDHNRPVFAIPGRVDNKLSFGPHMLIRDGATLVARLEDILDDLGPLPAAIVEPDHPGADRVEAEAPADPPAPGPSPSLSEAQRAILACMSTTPMSPDAIMDASGLEAAVVMREITVLSLRGSVRRAGVLGYVRGR